MFFVYLFPCEDTWPLTVSLEFQQEIVKIYMTDVMETSKEIARL